MHPAPHDPGRPRRAPDALVVVDLFVAGVAQLDRELLRRRAAAASIMAALIAEARGAGRPVIHAVDRSARPEATAAELVEAAQDAPSSALPEAVVPLLTEPVLLRTRPSAFDDASLEQWLAARGVQRVLMVGQFAEESILHSALDAVARGFAVTVVPAALVSRDAAGSRAALQLMRGNGVDVSPDGPLPSQAPGEPGASTGRSRRRRNVEPPDVMEMFATVLARTGYRGLKVADVASEAQTSLRTFYSVFPGGKEECVVTLFRQRVAALQQAIRDAAVREGEPGAARLRAGIAEAVRLLRANRRLIRALLVGLAALGEEAERTRDDALEQLAELLVEQSGEGPTGRSPRLALVARGLVGAMLELALDDTIDPGASTTADITATLIAMWPAGVASR